jgi:hypothetical protein
MTLEPDRDQLEIFLDAVLRYRGDEGYLSLRAFFHSNKPLHSNLWTARLGPRTGSQHVLDIAVDLARRSANTPEPAVFCPPLAVFNNSDGFKAREEDLFKGLAISVECDQHPEEARQKLQDILGQATAIVRSGGQWINGDGEPEDKLHVHFRLKTPATNADLTKLKQARRIAAALVGGDISNVPAVHCLRWPGSWHRKAEPRLCELVSCNPDVEIDLDEALVALEQAAPGRKKTGNGRTGEAADEAELIANGVCHGPGYSKCQWPDQTLDQAFGLPEVLVAVSTSRLSCKRTGKTRTLMPVWDSSGESQLLRAG